MWVLEQGSSDHALAWLQALYLREHVDFDGAAISLKRAFISVKHKAYVRDNTFLWFRFIES